jgi:flagellar FlgN protein
VVRGAFGALTTLLWREREILEHLVFRLVEQQLILSAGLARWLPTVDGEVRAAAESLQDHEVARAFEVDLLVQHFGLPPGTTLRELADVAPEPWPTMLLDHRDALLALTVEIDTVTEENRRLLTAGEQTARARLDRARRVAPDERQ